MVSERNTRPRLLDDADREIQRKSCKANHYEHQVVGSFNVSIKYIIQLVRIINVKQIEHNIYDKDKTTDNKQTPETENKDTTTKDDKKTN